MCRDYRMAKRRNEKRVNKVNSMEGVCKKSSECFSCYFFFMVQLVSYPVSWLVSQLVGCTRAKLPLESSFALHVYTT